MSDLDYTTNFPNFTNEFHNLDQRLTDASCAPAGALAQIVKETDFSCSVVGVTRDGRAAIEAQNGTGEKPPYSNRGVLCTHTDIPFIIHFLTYSFEYQDFVLEGICPETGNERYVPDRFELATFLFGSYEWLGRSKMQGCTDTVVFENGVEVSWHRDRPEQKMIFNMTGSVLEDNGDDPRQLLQYLCDMGAKFSRIDIARDDKAGYLDMSEIRQHIASGDIVSRFRSWDEVGSGKIGEECTGKTLYLGSKLGEVRFRAYDKAVEQKVDHHWIRFEGQFRKKVADKLVRLFLAVSPECQGEFLAGLFKNYADFKVHSDTDSNKRRWDTCSWWDDFLDVSEKVVLGLTRGVTTLHQAQEYFYNQMSGMIATIAAIDDRFLSQSLRRGKYAVGHKEKYKRRLDRWRRDYKKDGPYLPFSSSGGEEIDINQTEMRVLQSLCVC